MVFRFILLLVSLAVIIFVLDVLLPKLKQKYILYKESKIEKQKHETFKKNMAELEIK